MSAGKFDAALIILRGIVDHPEMDRLTIYEDFKADKLDEFKAAISVLEAAGKVDKDEAQTFLRAWYEENGLKVPGEREAYNHIRRFLDALPDEVKHE
jgi:hypothetical protein